LSMHFLLLLFFVALGSTGFVHDVPLFVWSGEDSYITARNQQIRGYYTTESVGDLLQGLGDESEKGGLLDLVKPDQQLELVVLIVNSALSSEELSLHHNCVPTLAEAMATYSSFYLPYVKSTKESFVSRGAWKACRSAHRNAATAYYMGPDSFLSHIEKHTPVTSVKSLSEISSSFNNGKTDVLVVYVDEESVGDQVMRIEQTLQELMNSFKAGGFSQYVVAVTSVESSLEDSLPTNEELGLPEDVKRAVLAEAPIPPNNGTYPPTIYNGRNTFNVYFNGVFWELFFVLLVFWGVVFMGLRQLLQVQAPDRIPNLNAHKKKK